MIEVAVSDAIYCSAGICQPLDWWSSAAAWAQAILTFITFAGTVIYQAVQSRAALRAKTVENLLAERDRLQVETALARIIVPREFRRWRRAIRQHLAVQYEDHTAEAQGSIALASQFTWEGDVRDIKLLGTIGLEIAGLISDCDEMIDLIEGPLVKSVEQRTPLDELVVAVRGQWRSIETKLTRAMKHFNDAGDNR